MGTRVWGAAAVVLAAALACDGGLEPDTSFVGISGTLTFTGAVPESTQAVFVVAYQTFPRCRSDLFGFQPPLSRLQSLPLNQPTGTFQLPLANAPYEWVLAVWVKQGFTPFNADATLREAGYYRDPVNPGQPGAVVVNDTVVPGIDFIVDFDNMHTVDFWFPTCAG
ncbi:MAG: hypothetical protein ACREMM_11090 [Gemmatimonadales bacterium]